MMRRRRPALPRVQRASAASYRTVGAVCACLLTMTAAAQTAPAAPAAAGPGATPAVTPAAPVPYQPSLSDMMNIGVQPRHIKLWLAGTQGNWNYATYELDELRNAFKRVARTTPVYRNLDMAKVLDTFTQEPLAALDAAIKARNLHAFRSAYETLTERCNACHLGAEHDMVVIKVPNGNAYVDQEFRPGKGSGAHAP